MKWTVDTRRRIALPGIHDASVERFAYDRHNQITLDIIGQGGEKTSIAMKSIYVINVNSLWESSIIDSIYAWDVADFPEDDWVQRDIGWHSLLEGRADTDAERRTESRRLSQRYLAAKLVSVSCSFGGTWSVLCGDIVIDQTTIVFS